MLIFNQQKGEAILPLNKFRWLPWPESFMNKKKNNFNPTKFDFINGLSNKKFIPAIKGNDFIYVLWSKEHVDYLKRIKAPLRNIRLYGENEKIYCKTSDYTFHKVDKNTLCINIAGSCFIMPIINLSLDYILKQITKEGIKKYIQQNINNSLCLTPNDLKRIPIRISDKL